MIYSDFTMQEHGFVGHMAEPENSAAQAVIVIMGGEKSLLPGIKIAERFADYGICDRIKSGISGCIECFLWLD